MKFKMTIYFKFIKLKFKIKINITPIVIFEKKFVLEEPILILFYLIYLI